MKKKGYLGYGGKLRPNFRTERIKNPEDLVGLKSAELSEFLRSNRTDKVELWNAWRAITPYERICIAQANLMELSLDKINFNYVDFIETTLTYTSLRHAHFMGATLNVVHLTGADLTHARFESAILTTCSLWRTKLHEASLRLAIISNSEFIKSHLENVILIEAIVRDCNFTEAILNNCSVYEAEFVGVDFRAAQLVNIRLSDAANLKGLSLHRTIIGDSVNIDHNKLIDAPSSNNSLISLWHWLTNQHEMSAIWQEREGRFNEAKQIFKTLKGHFESKGDYEAANWAYVREQLMDKFQRTPKLLRFIYPRYTDKWVQEEPRKFNDDPVRHIEYSDPDIKEWLRLELFEKLANYGVSLFRPLLCLALLVLGCGFIYRLGLPFLGGTMITSIPNCGYADLSKAWMIDCTPTYKLIHAIWFSFGALTSTEVGTLRPYLSHVGILMTLEILIGVALTGLFGFVLGNKLRNS